MPQINIIPQQITLYRHLAYQPWNGERWPGKRQFFSLQLDPTGVRTL